MRRFQKIISLSLCATICLASSGCVFLPDEEEVLAAPTVKTSEVKYTTVTAKRKNLVKKIVNSGTVTSEKQYNMSYANTGGTITEFYIHSGDVVKKGDSICLLDTTDLDYSIEEQELNLKKAKLDVQVITDNDGSQAEIDKAEVEVELIQNRLDKLKEQKEEALLVATSDGTITNVADVRVGDGISTGQTICTILDTSALYVAIKPSNDDSLRFNIGTEVTLEVDDTEYAGEVFMTPHDLDEYYDSLKDNHDAADETAITFEDGMVYIRFKDKIPTDAVGQLIDATLILDSVENAIVISNNLIKTIDDQTIVYVLKDGEKVAVDVEVGLQTGSQSEIKSGIDEGDEVILR